LRISIWPHRLRPIPLELKNNRTGFQRVKRRSRFGPRLPFSFRSLVIGGWLRDKPVSNQILFKALLGPGSFFYCEISTRIVEIWNYSGNKSSKTGALIPAIFSAEQKIYQWKKKKKRE